MTVNIDLIVNEMLEYTKHLPSNERIPIELIVLKGHLLIERQLNALIECALIKPQSLNPARLTFAKKVNLAEALYGVISSINWAHLRDINSIRNSMAHELEDDDLIPKIRRFINAVKGDDIKYVDGGLVEQLSYCVSYLHIELAKARIK